MSRRLWDIPGGVHPPERKTLSNQQPIRPVSLPAKLVVPLQQHIGAGAEPIVRVGQTVLKGQKIAEAKGFVSAPLHAPSSGTVVAIESHSVPHPSGMDELSIIIETDGNDRWCELDPVADFRQLETSELLNRIREAGIAGLGGAGFPAAVKLSARPEQEIRTLIINGTECEPYITADDLLMQERSDRLINGIDILHSILKPDEVLIAVEDNKPEAVKALRQEIAGRNAHYEVAVLPTKYPSGGEKQLIQLLTGREVPSGELPADLGIVCQNVGTAVAIQDAIIEGRPLISRVTTLTGEALNRRGNVDVLIGTPIEHLLSEADLNSSKLDRLIIGGPMMGFTLQTTLSPITKTVNCVIAASAEELPAPPPAQACIRCGECAIACPVNLLPQQLYWHARAKDFSQLRHHNLFDCIECGACSYSCPSHIPLVQYYRASKADIRAHEAMQQKAEYSKMRFEARESRLQRIEEEKAAKRKANAERAAKLKAAKAEAAAKENTGSDTAKEDKALNIQRAKVNAQIKKLQRQLDTADAAEQASLQANLTLLQQQLDKLQPSSSPSTDKTSTDNDSPAQADNPSTEKDHKAAKIKLAMARAALKKNDRAIAKAQEAGDNISELEQEQKRLRAEVLAAEQAMAEEPVAPQKKPTSNAKAPRTPLSDSAKKLKIEAAMIRAALKKAERAYADSAQNNSEEQQALSEEVKRLQEELETAQQRVDSELVSQDSVEKAANSDDSKTTSTAEKEQAAQGDQEAEIKRLKIRLAMAKAAVKKAQRTIDSNGESPERIQALKKSEEELAQASLDFDRAATETTGD
ncbi:electron transport complex subunit RsxC [Aestuariirhabdus sp. Z084]|uniref:electron transport complex subunit RsxC n=1 Tax=Aestuariirhabdus haliotis TaxID=2918751 RepID=UPI00201B4423|nr:electron transport complex subunit RsxC [Aestuariirhabdus haliotis]MCL6417402.1 electron transport complex subunit RsxC [Aestuariirhabdus haliotis]MCL6421346.1 electron transport complex subunit RsxC [Aestuariirhabdus haliotis]